MEEEELVIKSEKIGSPQHSNNTESEEIEEEEEEEGEKAKNNKTPIVKTKKSNPRIKFDKISVYWKRSALKYLKESGCQKEHWRNHIKRCEDTETLEQYMVNIGKYSQDNVCNEVNSSIFHQISSWIDKFEEKHFDDHCNNELSTVMKLIAETEDHPPPEDCDGINFKDLYQFFASVMKGEPTKELDYSTKQFLWECFNDLINEVNGEVGDLELAKMMEAFKKNENECDENENESRLDVSCLSAQDQFQLGLDPLKLSDISKQNLM